jgi:hypothetical protein
MEEWIAQLNSDSWKQRQSAADHLVALGEDAVPRLQQLVKATDDDETRTRAAAAIAQIDENRLTGASLVTLKLESVPAADALAELARQARGAIPTEPANLLSRKEMKRVSLDADHRPFWEVMQSLSAQTELAVAPINRHNHEIGLGLTSGSTEWMDRPIALSGPLLIRADNLVRKSRARLKPPIEVSQEFGISFTVFAEPKLKVMDYSTVLRLDEVTDDKGNSLIPPPDNDAVPANVDVFGNTRDGNTSHWELGATLHYPKGAGTTITRFRASATAQVQTRSAMLDLPLASAKNATRNVGGLRVTVRNVDPNRCELSVYRDGRSDAEWFAVRMQLYASRARLTDEPGTVVARSQPGPDADDSPDNNQRMDVRMRLTREGAEDRGAAGGVPSTPTRLLWEFPTELRQLTVPFEFRDLPIP